MAWTDYVRKIPVIGALAPPEEQSSVNTQNTRLQHGGELYGTAQTEFNRIGQRRAPQANQTVIAQNERARAAEIDGSANRSRGDQIMLQRALQLRMNGTGGPSVAENQLRQGLAANLRAQLAAQAASRGGPNPLAMRNVAQGAAQANQQLVGQQALLRAQEQRDAEQQLGGLLSGIRGQDIGLATTQAGLNQQSNLFNAGQTNERNLSQAQLAQQANIANVDAQLRARGMDDAARQAYLQAMFGVDRANQQAELDAQRINADIEGKNLAANSAWQSGLLETGANITKMATSDERAKKKVRRAATDEMLDKMDAEAVTARPEELTRERKGKKQQDAYMGQKLDAPRLDDRALYMTSDERAKKLQEKADQAKAEYVVRQSPDLLGRFLDWATGKSTHEGQVRTWFSQDRPTDETQAELDRAGARDAFEKSEAERYRNMSPTEIRRQGNRAWMERDAQAEESKEQQADKRAQAEAQYKTGVTNVDPSEGDESAYLRYLRMADPKLAEEQRRKNMLDAQKRLGLRSDKRSKGKVSKTSAADEFVDALVPYEYEYKEPEKHGYGRRMGVLAQDVEKGGPMGKALVSEGPDGYKQIDVGKGLSAALAALASMNDRLKKVEGK